MITGTITTDDYLRAQRLHRAKSERLFFLASGIAIALGFLALALPENLVGYLLIGAGIGGIVGEAITSFVYLPWKVRRLHRQQGDLASPFTYKWDSEYLHAEGLSGYSKRKWASYLKCKEDDVGFLLYHSDNMFEMFPKHWFENSTQIEEFKMFASNAGLRASNERGE